MIARLKKSGFTLVELLVVVGILALVIGASFMLLSTSRFSVDLSEAQIQAIDYTRLAIEQISRELRLSHFSRVFISDQVGLQINANSGSVLNFQIPVGSYDSQLSLDDYNSLRWGSEEVENDYIAYYRNENNELIRRSQTQAGLSEKIVARNISSLSPVEFYREDSSSKLIYLEITVEQPSNLGQTITKTLRTWVKLRN